MAEKLGTVGVLDILIGGSSALFQRAVDDAERGMGRLGDRLAEAAKAGTLFAAAAAAAGAAVFAFANNVAAAQDEIAKTAEKVGVAVEDFSALKYAADISNVSMESLATGMRQLAKNMLDASAGTGDAKDAFKALGVQVTDAQGKLKPTRDQLLELSDKFMAMKGSSEATAYALRIFGKSGSELIPLLNQGRAGIEALMKEAERLGLVISQDAARAADEFRDNLDRLQGVVTGLKYELAGPFIKSLSDVAKAFLDAKRDGESFFATLSRVLLVATQGSDAQIMMREMTGLGKVLVDAQNELDEARRLAREVHPGLAEMANARVDVAAARVKQIEDRLRTLRDIMADPFASPAAPGAPGGKPGGGPTPGALAAAKAEEERQKEIAAARQKAFGILERQQKEADDAENRQIASQVQAKLDAEAKFQQQQYELREMFEEQDIERAQAELERRRLLKEFGFRSDEELENERHAARMAQLSIFTEDELAQIGGKQAAIERLTRDHQGRLSDIEKRAIRSREEWDKASSARRLRTVFGDLEDLTAGVAQHNRALFNLNKIAGIANAIISAHAGAAKSLEVYPWPLAGVMAALHYAAGLARVAAIRATTFGGGAAGAVAPSAAATPAPAVTPVGGGAGAAAATEATTIINFQGTTDERKLLRRFVELLNEQRRDGGGRFVLGSR